MPVRGELHFEGGRVPESERTSHPPPAVGRPEERAAADLATREQAAVGGEGNRLDLAVGGKPRNPLAACDVEDLDSVGTFVGESTERNRQLRAVRAERQPEHGGRQAQRRSKQLAPADVPDPHRAPHLRRGEQIALAEGERLDGSRVGRPRAPGSAKERAELLSRLGVPDPDAATLSRHRQPPSIGRVIDRHRRPAGEGLEAAVLRSVSASISSTRPSSLATARVRPSGLSANAGG